MGKTARISEEAEAFIKAHAYDLSRVEAARLAGVSLTTVYRVLRDMGAKMDYSRSTRNPEHVKIVREHYATMTGGEISARFGVRAGRVNNIARDLGLKHTPETLARINAKSRANLKKGQKHVDDAARVRKWKARWKMDQYRVWEGKPQKTRFRYSRTPRRTAQIKWYLVTRYGYYLCEDDPFAMLYDSHTRRLKTTGDKRGTENYFTIRYGLKFYEEEK